MKAMPKSATIVSGMRLVKGAAALAVPKSTVVFAPQTFVKAVFTSCAQAGSAFAPTGLVFFAASGFVGPRFVNRSGVRSALVIGESLSLAGYLLLTHISATGSYATVVLPATVVIALGTGLAFPAYSIAALMGAERGEEGLASGLINTSRQMGGPVGIAVLTTVATLLDPVGPGTHPYAGLVAGLDFAFVVAAALAGAAVLFGYFVRSEGRVPVTMTADTV